MPEIPPRTATETVDIAPGLSFQWLLEGQIPMILLKSMEQKAVDSYVELSLKLHEEWPADKPFITIHNMSEAGLSPSPYFRDALEKMMQKTEMFSLKGHAIMILPAGIMGNLITRMGRFFVLRKTAAVAEHYFTDYQKALAKAKALLDEVDSTTG